MSLSFLPFDAAVEAFALALQDAEGWFWEPESLCHPNGTRVEVQPSPTGSKLPPDVTEVSFSLAYHTRTLQVNCFDMPPIVTQHMVSQGLLLDHVRIEHGEPLSFWKNLLQVNFSLSANQAWQGLKARSLWYILAQRLDAEGQYILHPTSGFLSIDHRLPPILVPQDLIDAVAALRGSVPLVFSQTTKNGSILQWGWGKQLEFIIPASAHAKAELLRYLP